MVLLRELLAQAAQGRGQSQVIEPGGVQLMRESLHVSRDEVGFLKKLSQALLRFSGQLRQMLLQLLNVNGQQAKLLIDIVMQLTRDSGALVCLCSDQPAAYFRARRL